MKLSIKASLSIMIGSFCSMASAADCMVLASGRHDLQYVSRDEGGFQFAPSLRVGSEIENPESVSYSKFIEGLVFGARDDWNYGIFKSISDNGYRQAELISKGMYPFVSPEGNRVAYFNNHKLVVNDLESGALIPVGDTYYDSYSVWDAGIWINNSELLYPMGRDGVYLFSLMDKTVKKAFSGEMTPVAVMKNGEILFVSNDAFSVLGYKDGQLRTIMKNKSLNFGTRFVALSDGFLFTRQTWSSLFRLSEMKSTFYYSLAEKKELGLVMKQPITGGMAVPCEMKQPITGGMAVPCD